MSEQPLFSKSLDDLLPPDNSPPRKEPSRSADARPAARRRTEGPEEEGREVRWWQGALGGGLAIMLIFYLRWFVRTIPDGFAGADWAEFAGLSVLTFAVGCVLGVAFWGFDRLKARFTGRK